MNIPASEHFTPIPLAAAFNTSRHELPNTLRVPDHFAAIYGSTQFCGIPFELGFERSPNVIHLRDNPVVVEVGDVKATYFLFLHAVEDIATNYLQDLADYQVDGNELGTVVSDYTLEYEDGETAPMPILRRFAIQQSRIQWGASAFAAVPATGPEIFMTATEEQSLGRMPAMLYGRGETRHRSGRDAIPDNLWIYALPNPHPDKPVRRIILQPRTEASTVYAISYTGTQHHPLRPGLRQKLRLTLPEGVTLNALGELDDVAIDLGEVISTRAVLEYDEEQWTSRRPLVLPEQSAREVIIEHAAHPLAKLYVRTGPDAFAAYELGKLDAGGAVSVGAAQRPVEVRIVEKDTGKPAAVRLHIHGQDGEYLPPRGHHRKVNGYWFEDNYAEFVNIHNQYSYVEGECIVDLPLGVSHFELTRGYEVSPIRSSIEISPETEELTFELEKVLHWREEGWVTADTHVHFLSPQTALLEGRAEGVNVVNLLASQWGEMFSNVGDFDGHTTFGAGDFGGDGEFLVRVGTENRMQVLGHISLLGYSGAMIHPLCTGGPSESAVGDAQEVTMAEWAQRCIDQSGLVVLPHGPNPQLERAADVVLGVVNAIEMMTFNPLDSQNLQVSPYGIADWYRFLNLGYHVPVVGGSDKMSASSLLGGIRTYAHLGDREFAYQNWMDAVRAGNTFVTVGPLVSLSVDGIGPGSKLHMSATGGTVSVEWKVESAMLPVEQVELVVGGFAVEQVNLDRVLSAHGSANIPITDSTWIALRVRGSYRDIPGEIAAHSSAVQVLVEGKELFSEPDAIAVLEQIEGSIAYVDTIAPRPDAIRFKQLRATLESAYNRLHQRMHSQGLFHRHTPVSLHDHSHTHEH
jgi:hypothetical protein